MHALDGDMSLTLSVFFGEKCEFYVVGCGNKFVNDTSRLVDSAAL